MNSHNLLAICWLAIIIDLPDTKRTIILLCLLIYFGAGSGNRTRIFSLVAHLQKVYKLKGFGLTVCGTVEEASLLVLAASEHNLPIHAVLLDEQIAYHLSDGHSITRMQSAATGNLPILGLGEQYAWSGLGIKNYIQRNASDTELVSIMQKSARLLATAA